MLLLFSFCLDVKVNKLTVQQPMTTVAYIHLGHVCTACLSFQTLKTAAGIPEFVLFAGSYMECFA